MEYEPIVIPFVTQIPDKIIQSDIGICLKCFSIWIEGSGCTNIKCPEIIYRKIPEGA